MKTRVANVGIRRKIEKSGFKHWEVAHQIGIDRTTLVAWLRVPLTAERKEKILTAIEKLKT